MYETNDNQAVTEAMNNPMLDIRELGRLYDYTVSILAEYLDEEPPAITDSQRASACHPSEEARLGDAKSARICVKGVFPSLPAELTVGYDAEHSQLRTCLNVKCNVKDGREYSELLYRYCLTEESKIYNKVGRSYDYGISFHIDLDVSNGKVAIMDLCLALYLQLNIFTQGKEFARLIKPVLKL